MSQPRTTTRPVYRGAPEPAGPPVLSRGHRLCYLVRGQHLASTQKGPKAASVSILLTATSKMNGPTFWNVLRVLTSNCTRAHAPWLPAQQDPGASPERTCTSSSARRPNELLCLAAWSPDFSAGVFCGSSASFEGDGISRRRVEEKKHLSTLSRSLRRQRETARTATVLFPGPSKGLKHELCSFGTAPISSKGPCDTMGYLDSSRGSLLLPTGEANLKPYTSASPLKPLRSSHQWLHLHTEVRLQPRG